MHDQKTIAVVDRHKGVFMRKVIVFTLVLGAILASCAGKNVGIKNDPALDAKLLAAVKENKPKAVQRMLAKGANPNAAVEGGKNTVFHFALYMNDAKAIGLLLDAGADVNAPDKSNASPLSLAAQRNNVDVIARLLDAGVDVNTVNKNAIWSTALMDAAESNSIDAMKALMARGADINIVDKWNAPAITIAADKNNDGAVRLLADAGAELNIVDSGRGYTALDFAIKNKNDALVEYLRGKGAQAHVFK